ncbi:sphingomyelin phosphodiesterase-like [Styela clava]
MEKKTISLFIIFFVIVTKKEFSSALPTNISEEAELRFIKNVYEGEDSRTLFMEKVQKLGRNNTDAELNMLLPYNNLMSLGSLKCSACKLTLEYALWKFKKPDGTYDGLPEFVESACKRLKIETTDVCDGIVTTYKSVVLTLLHELQLTGEQVCGLILPSTCYSADLPWNKIKWNVTIPGVIPKNATSSYTRNTRGTKSTARVLHLSDIHMDLNYKLGGNVDCSEPLCCRDTKKMKSDSRQAGYWGSLGYCDTPYWTLENFLQQTSKNTYDYIIWTGDLPAHNDWSQSRDNQISVLYNLTSLLIKYFPKTPIYPSLGNHESFPVNSFPPRYVDDNNSITWLYKALTKAWSPWLPADALKSVSQSGCYTTLVRPRFRIVSLNMNYCNQQNWWMLINPVDPNHELEWLVSTLLKAELNDERVHILGHIPPGSPDCLPIWSHNYYNIINRFKDTIVAQFFGHTHWDQLEIFYDEKTKSVPTNMAYVAPSITTYPNMHPGYREYVTDGLYEGSTWKVLDHSTYILNLTKVNSQPATQEAKWDMLYSARSAFNLTDLSATSWNELVNTWITQDGAESSFQKYYYYFYKGNPPTPVCDKSCKKSMLCDIKSARSGDSQDFCNNL